MDLSKTKLYKAIKDPSLSASEVWRMCKEYVSSRKNINVMDRTSGETFLHVLAGHGGHVLTPWGVSTVYLLASSGLNLDARDTHGDTCLHKAVRVPGSFRVVEALMRCGVDPLIRNNDGRTADEVLQTEQPSDWRHTLHWYNKYAPGLYHAAISKNGATWSVERLLKGWCRARLTRPDGQEVALAGRLPIADATRDMLRKYEVTNEFVISMLAGKHMDLDAETLAMLDVETKDHMSDGGPPLHPTHHSHKPRAAPRPLLLALAEGRLEASVDTVLALGANPNIMFSSTGYMEDAEPLFFHLISSEPRPPDTLVHKVLRVADMSVRNQSGQTLLFRAIDRDLSSQFIRALFKYGVDVAARDAKGRTARDYAENLKKTKYLTTIDEHVTEIVKECDLEKLQSIVFQGYDHILDITDNKGINITQTFRHFQTLNPNKEEMELRRLASRKLVCARDKCGRTVLHKAILNKKKELIKFIIQTYGHIIDVQDNLGRVALHYAYLVTEGTSLVNYLQLHGADTNVSDWAGRLPAAYQVDACGKDEYIRLQRALNAFTMDVYLAETNFEHSLNKAVKRGDVRDVEDLVHGLTDRGDVNRYANVLFTCVDTGRQSIAVCLIRHGMRTDIYKQYETCDSRSSACSTYTCDHVLTSLYTRAKQMKCLEVLKAISDVSEKSSDVEVDGRPSIRGPSTMDQFSLLGMV
ncbi:hypothetical protein MAR_023266 [Mya arenaria]|uniref:Ankyrin repeat protein n=1 Tax=Mya arenaria TaxID=6604 RepID=A0ABY7DS26_MYAAR|nr:hypothetical protein MAR_023266 [Mya arenaria]